MYPSFSIISPSSPPCFILLRATNVNAFNGCEQSSTVIFFSFYPDFWQSGNVSFYCQERQIKENDKNKKFIKTYIDITSGIVCDLMLVLNSWYSDDLFYNWIAFNAISNYSVVK